jgi:putative tryptophan/tyrosine transport system ATP-binding protein
VIQLNSISKSFFDGAGNEVNALKEINLSFAEKEFVVIVGSNGSGKSTLLNLIAGAYKPTQGEILLDGKEINHLKDFERSKWIARIFQNPLHGTAPDLSIIDNFRLAALRTKSKMLSIGTTKKFITNVKSKVSLLGLGLENKLSQNMGTLSGGQRQALTLLMAVMETPQILLMDEPTAALDPRSAETLMQTADKIITIFNLNAILVTHNLKEAFTFGNRIIQMKEGKVDKDFSVEQKSKLVLTEIYSWF